MKTKNVYIIAGPNGSGKTTFAREFLPQYAHCQNFVNADLFAQAFAPFSPKRAALKAGKLLLNEIHRLADYARKDYCFSYLCTKDGVEIDLIIERPGAKRALVEIKSTEKISEDDIRGLERIAKDIPSSESFCLSRDPVSRRIGSVQCLPWMHGLEEMGL